MCFSQNKTVCVKFIPPCVKFTSHKCEVLSNYSLCPFSPTSANFVLSPMGFMGLCEMFYKCSIHTHMTNRLTCTIMYHVPSCIMCHHVSCAIMYHVPLGCKYDSNNCNRTCSRHYSLACYVSAMPTAAIKQKLFSLYRN